MGPFVPNAGACAGAGGDDDGDGGRDVRARDVRTASEGSVGESGVGSKDLDAISLAFVFQARMDDDTKVTGRYRDHVVAKGLASAGDAGPPIVLLVRPAGILWGRGRGGEQRLRVTGAVRMRI